MDASIRGITKQRHHNREGEIGIGGGKRCSGKQRKHRQRDVCVGAAPRVWKPAAYLALLFPKKKSSAVEYVRALKCASAPSRLPVTATSCEVLAVSSLLPCSVHPHVPFLSFSSSLFLCLSAQMLHVARICSSSM